MLKKYSILLSLVLTLSLNSQNIIKLSEGDSIIDFNDYKFAKSILIENGLLSIHGQKGSGDSITVDYLSIERKKYKRVKMGPLDEGFLHFYKIGSNIFGFKSEIDKKANKHILYAQKFNETTLRFEGEIKQVFEIDYGKAMKDELPPYSVKIPYGNFVITFSPNGKLLMIYQNFPYTTGENQTIKFSVLDSIISIVKEVNTTLPIKDKQYGNEFGIINNRGDVYFVGSLFKGKVKLLVNSRTNLDRKYTLACFKFNSKTPKVCTLPDKKMYYRNFVCCFDKNDQFIFACPFSFEMKDQAIGFFLARLSPENFLLKDTSSFLFPQNLEGVNKTALGGYKIKSKEKPSSIIKHLECIDIKVEENNDIVLVAEQRYIGDDRNFKASSFQNYKGLFVFNWNDLVIARFTSSFESKWISRIHKLQSSFLRYTPSASTKVIWYNNKAYLFFNDDFNVDNCKGLVCYSLSENGEINSFKFQKPTSSDDILPSTLYLNKGRMYLYGIAGRWNSAEKDIQKMYWVDFWE